MNESHKTHGQLLDELKERTSRMTEAEETLRAILSGEVDGLVVSTAEGDRVFTLSGADHPYRIMVETMNEGAVTLTSVGMILYCNKRFADIVKKPIETLIGSSIFQYLSSTNIQLLEILLKRSLKENAKAEMALQIGGEKTVPVFLSISALKHSDMQGMICIVVTDLSEQKRNEEILAEGKLTTQILDQASEIFVLCDNQGNIIRASQSANMFFGESPVFQSFEDAFHLIYTDGTHFDLLSVVSDEMLDAVEVTFKHADRNAFYFLLRANPLITPKGSVGIVVVMVDITTRKKMEEALKRSNDELEEKIEKRTEELFIAKEESEKGRQKAENAYLEIKKLKDQLEAERSYLQEEIKLEFNHDKIIGKSDGLKYVLYKIEQIAETDTSILILGETGTGKELVARAIHALSFRKNRAMIKVNCAALPANLIESELFGHEKGAFTGSHSRQLGRFEIANDTSLFLDEIGELPLELQAKLLRVLQDGEFERLGSSTTIKVDVRIIAATNRNLEEEVRNKNFREDLWYRLNVFPITMPPLRDRKEDIPLIVDFYIKKISKRMGKTIEIIPTGVMDALQNYHWPGNVRELENILERGIINTSGPKLRLIDELTKPYKNFSISNKTLEAFEREYIMRVLKQTHWKVGGKNSAAEILGLDRSTLRARMRKLDIQKP